MSRYEYTGGKPVGLLKARLTPCHGCGSLITLGLRNIGAAPDSKSTAPDRAAKHQAIAVVVHQENHLKEVVMEKVWLA